MTFIPRFTFRFLITLFLTSGVSLLTSPSFAYDPPPQSEADFQKWLANFKKSATQKGLSATTLQKAFDNIHLNQRVLELDRRQPEFSQTFWQYFNRAVTRWRIEKGQALAVKYADQLREVTKKYGVPERFLLAFWGMETNYGGYTGNTPIIESLATLSYDPRRSDFFTRELISALTIIEEGNVEPRNMKGSWAGAMGQCQFMPSNYLKFAVDADHSGKRDLWDSLPDVFYSMGNFLNHLGWQKEENWGREIKLPKGFDLSLADGKTMRPLSEWQKMGLKLADGRAIPKADLSAALLLPYDYRGPAFLVFNNFFVIKRWNRSDNYALAVGHLADRIVGRSVLSKKAPKDDKALNRQQLMELQERLKVAGFEIGYIDGIAGAKTRQAIRAFQKSNQLPADGYPSYRMLKILRQKAKHS